MCAFKMSGRWSDPLGECGAPSTSVWSCSTCWTCCWSGCTFCERRCWRRFSLRRLRGGSVSMTWRSALTEVSEADVAGRSSSSVWHSVDTRCALRSPETTPPGAGGRRRWLGAGSVRASRLGSEALIDVRAADGAPEVAGVAVVACTVAISAVQTFVS